MHYAQPHISLLSKQYPFEIIFTNIETMRKDPSRFPDKHPIPKDISNNILKVKSTKPNCILC